ncbi:MAG TPA: WD40 repeat domain-containing protein, partial [Cyclobacteriaceae bacterium]|nr:WD40 repeat domain-containing protein [Cyclobacteriaceae bacterium]
MIRLKTILLFLPLFFAKGLPAQKIEITVQKGHSAEITFVAFNEDGKLLASYGKDNLIKLWHVPTGKEMVSFISASSLSVKSLAFSPGDDFLHVLYDDGTVHSWDIAASSLKSTDQGKSGLLFSNQKKYRTSDSSFLVYVDRFYMRKQNRKTNKNSFSRVPVDISQHFTSVAVSEKTQHIFGACQDGKIYVYDFAHGKGIKTLGEHLSSVNSVCISPTGDFLASASDDRSIIIWDIKSLRLVKRLFGRSYRFESLSFDHSGTLLAVGDEFGKGRIINLQSSRLNVSAYPWHDKKVSDIKFSSDDRFVYSAGFDNLLCSFDLLREKVVRKEKYLNYFNPSDIFFKNLNVYREPFAWINTISISPNDQFLIAGGAWAESVQREQPQVLWFKNLSTGVVQRIRTHRGAINSLAFNSNLGFVSGSDNELFQWYYNVANRQFYFHKSQLKDAREIRSVIPGSGDTVVINTGDNIIGYDLRHEKEIFTLQPEHGVRTLAADGKSTLAYSSFNELVLYNT